MNALTLSYSPPRYNNDWRLGTLSVQEFYASKQTHFDSDGPPAGGAGFWSAVGATHVPVPASITCDGSGGGAVPSCSCVHAVSCAACHTAEVYYPGTSVELAQCNTNVAAGGTTHIQWLKLSVGGGNESGTPNTSGMLMSGGLCLGMPTPGSSPGDEGNERNGDDEDATLPTVHRGSESMSSASSAVEVTAALVSVAKVRITVLATNGVDTAIINEVRLYGADGAAPFPKQQQ
jgi:hypothetical protein